MDELLERGTLPVGVEADGTVHAEFELRPATLADIYKAAAAVPIPAGLGSSDATSVAYQMAVDDAAILCQITRLGTLVPVPAPAALTAMLDPDDMVILRQTAEDMKKKLRATRSNLRTTGAPNAPSCAPA